MTYFARAPYLQHALQLSNKLADLAEAGDERSLTATEEARLARAIAQAKASVRVQREAWQDACEARA